MKTPPPYGLVCAAGVFVLGRHCPYSGESLPLPGSPPGSLSAPEEMPSFRHASCPKYVESPSAAPPFCRAAQSHTSRGPVPGKSSCARNPAGQSASAGRNAVFPACSLPREYGTVRLPLRSQTKTPPSSGENQAEGGVLFYQAAEELSSSLLVWDSASSGFSGSAVSSSSGI